MKAAISHSCCVMLDSLQPRDGVTGVKGKSQLSSIFTFMICSSNMMETWKTHLSPLYYGTKNMFLNDCFLPPTVSFQHMVKHYSYVIKLIPSHEFICIFVGCHQGCDEEESFFKRFTCDL